MRRSADADFAADRDGLVFLLAIDDEDDSLHVAQALVALGQLIAVDPPGHEFDDRAVAERHGDFAISHGVEHLPDAIHCGLGPVLGFGLAVDGEQSLEIRGPGFDRLQEFRSADFREQGIVADLGDDRHEVGQVDRPGRKRIERLGCPHQRAVEGARVHLLHLLSLGYGQGDALRADGIFHDPILGGVSAVVQGFHLKPPLGFGFGLFALAF